MGGFSGVDSAIAQGVRPIQIDPTLALQRRVQLGELASQQQERMAQAQTLQAQAQERQQAFQDQTALRQAFIDSGGDFDKLPQLAIQNGARVPAVQAAQTAHEALVTSLLANDKNRNELAISHHDQLGRLIDGVSQLPPEQRDAAMPGMWAKAAQLLPPDELQTAQQVFHGTDDQTLNAFKATVDYGGNLAKEAVERQNAQATTQNAATNASKEQREAATATAELPGTKADAERKQLVTAAMKAALANPEQGSDAIHAALDGVDDQAAHGFLAQYHNAMALGNVEGAQAAVKAAADHAAQLSPAMRQKAVDQAVAVEKATAPLKIAQQVSAARALRQGDNPALAGVAPADIPRVNATAQKLDQDYITAKTSAEDIGKLLDLAGAGNKAAGANVPLAGVAAINAVNGIKRINSAEIQQYGTAGSLMDKIQGKLQGWTEGQPIPKDVLNDMTTLHEQLSHGAWDKYTQGLDALNKRSGAKLTTTVDPIKPRQAGPSAVKTINTKADYDALPSGSLYVDSQDGKTYKKR